MTDPISFAWAERCGLYPDWRDEARGDELRTVQTVVSYDGNVIVWKTNHRNYKKITWTRMAWTPGGSNSVDAVSWDTSVEDQRQLMGPGGCCALQ